MFVLGLNAYHGDSAACLIQDGSIVAAAEEERFRRVKHWAGFPRDSIEYCLQEGNVSLSDITHIAINSNPSRNIWKKLQFALTMTPSFGFIADRVNAAIRRVNVVSELETTFRDSGFRGEIHRVEHHLSHLASAFLVSPFRDATVVSVDGFGDFSSTAWGIGSNEDIEVQGRIFFPHSLGIFYQALTQYLGFWNYGDEYKVMGLAPYGSPSYLSQLQKVVILNSDGTFHLNTDFFTHHKERISFVWSGGSPSFGRLFSPHLESLLGPCRNSDEPLEARHRDIARSVQSLYELAFFNLLNSLYEKHKLDSVTLAGGCAMNSVANGKIMRSTAFKRVYVQAAAGDAGGAIGAAMYVSRRSSGGHLLGSSEQVLAGEANLNRSVMSHAYLGPSFSDDHVAEVLRSLAPQLAAENCEFQLVASDEELCRVTAESISRGDVVGWFQGRMEWGPRALGNRSIVCDPRRSDIKDILNLKIKRRESFRPFAPSILSEHVDEWFEEGGDVPFMMQVYQVREPKRSVVPAVCHVDGSGRLQSVYKSTNSRYWHLISEFKSITGVPMVLNTSFNENEPIVCKPEEALHCFLRTKMDILAIGRWLVRRSN